MSMTPVVTVSASIVVSAAATSSLVRAESKQFIEKSWARGSFCCVTSENSAQEDGQDHCCWHWAYFHFSTIMLSIFLKVSFVFKTNGKAPGYDDAQLSKDETKLLLNSLFLRR